MGGVTDIHADALLAATVNAQALPVPTAWEVALFTGSTGLEAGFPTQELAASGYTRKPVTWTNVSAQMSANDANIDWVPTEPWPTLTHIGVTDQLGNFILWGPLSSAVDATPPQVARILAGALTVDFSAVTFVPTPHAGTHTIGGSDVVSIDYSQMVGTFPLHAADHAFGGIDEVTIDYNQIVGVQPPPVPHTHVIADVTDMPSPIGAEDSILQVSDGQLEYVDHFPVYGTGLNDTFPVLALTTVYQIVPITVALFDQPTGVVDLANDQLKFLHPGVYMVNFNMGVDFAAAGTIEIGVFDNGVEVVALRQTTTVAIQQNAVTFSLDFSASFAGAETVDVRARLQAGADNMTVQEFTLCITRIGVGT